MVLIFKNNNPSNNLLLFFYALILKVPSFLEPFVPTADSMDGFLYRVILRRLTELDIPSIFPVLSFILVYAQAIFLNRFVLTKRLNQKASYLPGMSLILITSLIPEWEQFSSTLIANTFLVWVISRLCILHNNATPKTLIFNIGLSIGLSSFFYFPSLGFIILVLISLIISRPFFLQEWLLFFIGIVIPYYFFASWVFLTDRTNNYQLPVIKVTRHLNFNNSWYFLAAAAMIIGILAGIYFIRKNLFRQLVQIRKSWNIIFVYLIISALVPFINNGGIRLDYWILTAIPAAFILAPAFVYPQKKWFPISLHWLFVAIILAFSYLGLVN